MNKSLVFVIFLIFCSAALSKQKGYSAIIDKLVQLNQAVGKDKQDIAVLVSQVSNVINEEFDLAEKFFSSVEGSCSNGKLLISAYTNKLNVDSLALDAEITNAKDNIAKSTKEVYDFKTQLFILKKHIEEELKQIEKLKEDYVTFGKETEEKLISIRAVREIINDELISPNKSFVQLQTREFMMRIVNLRNILTQVSANESMFGSVVMTLLQLAEKKGFSDQKILLQILGVLSKLEKNMEDFRKKQQTEGKTIIKNKKDSIEAAKSQAKTLLSMMNSAESVITDSQDLIVSANKAKQAIALTIARKKTEFEFWLQVCDFQNTLKTNERDVREAFSNNIAKVVSSLTPN